MEERNIEENNEDDDLFGEDIAFSQESVNRRLGKVQKRNRLTKKVCISKETQQNKTKEKITSNDNNHVEEDSDYENFKTTVGKKISRKEDYILTIEKTQEKVGTTNEQVSQVITIDDEEREKSVIKLNVKVYKRKESNILVIKTLVVALYRNDLVKKLVTYISKNLNPKPEKYLEDIKVYFDGDLVNMDMKIKEIGAEDEEQLEVKVPFECNWIK
ncbi:Ubiquitin-2 like Rad60 SUMO-like family protein [Cryptosporidium meleagridis]|uniref:Ubiquitin-2 like Rad60 SUMO-like family protein n=1 Tax=Cryptosporidium meleagridis TaxID=93969 RepID=A0A2P4YXC7_9CRYT|nr:Ubiquitin-2 like Rad60 SUMO-like family protein [Cryptosporidium meleagridis]